MADAKNRQRKLAAKSARRKAVVAEKKKSTGVGGLSGKIALAARGPIVHCIWPKELFKTGIGVMILARSLPSGLLGCGIFLVDTWCLGVKDAFYREEPPKALQLQLAGDLSRGQTLESVDPSTARKVLRAAAAYAAGFGLSPAEDFAAVEKLFGSVDAAASSAEFTFGLDGKPCFAQGPGDTPASIRRIIETLQRHCGEGNWHSIIGNPMMLGNPLSSAGIFDLVDERELDDDDDDD